MANKCRRTAVARLKQADTQIESAAKLLNKAVVDAKGNAAGKVISVWADDFSQRARFIEIVTDPEKSRILAPVEKIDFANATGVYLNVTRHTLQQSPYADPRTAMDDFLLEIYTYYAVLPFWLSGHVYPMIPVLL